MEQDSFKVVEEILETVIQDSSRRSLQQTGQDSTDIADGVERQAGR